jgi:thiol-disulfide isomerase/thioredoxin
MSHRIAFEEDRPTVVLHLATAWCLPCKRFAPQRIALMSQNNKLNVVHNGMIDYRLYEHGIDDVVQQSFKISSYPTILVFSPKHESFAKYNGDHTAAQISEFAFNYHRNKLTTPPEIWTTKPRLVNVVIKK